MDQIIITQNTLLMLLFVLLAIVVISLLLFIAIWNKLTSLKMMLALREPGFSDMDVIEFYEDRAEKGCLRGISLYNSLTPEQLTTELNKPFKTIERPFISTEAPAKPILPAQVKKKPKLFSIIILILLILLSSMTSTIMAQNDKQQMDYLLEYMEIQNVLLLVITIAILATIGLIIYIEFFKNKKNKSPLFKYKSLGEEHLLGKEVIAYIIKDPNTKNKLAVISLAKENTNEEVTINVTKGDSKIRPNILE